MTESLTSRLPQPPRLLLGTVLLIWGSYVDHPLIALAAALLVEGRHWLSWRWDFGPKGYVRAWVISLLALTITIVLHATNSTQPDSLLGFIRWLPVSFLPLILAQQYGADQAIPSTVFSAYAQRRQRKAIKMGRPEKNYHVHFGYPYFLLVLLAISHGIGGTQSQARFTTIFLVLIAAAFFTVNRQGLRRTFPWFAAISLVALITAMGSYSLLKLYEWVASGGLHKIPPIADTGERITKLGQLGKVKLDRSIQWRFYPTERTRQTKHVMISSFNNFSNSFWTLRDPEGNGMGESSFFDLATSTSPSDQGEFSYEATYFALNNSSKSPGPRLRGRIVSPREAIPLLSNTSLIADAQEIDALESNLLGTLMALNASSVVDYEMWTSPENHREQSPRNQIDRYGRHIGPPMELVVPADEHHALHRLASELKLLTGSEQEKISRLRNYLSTFRYTTHLTIGNNSRITPLSDFLTETKAGHCEYFASATALLLRQAGIPTRYVIGYAVREKGSDGEYLLRGSHSHAWCRAYLGGKKTIEQQTIIGPYEKNLEIEREVWQGGQWVDIDLTPPDWLNLDNPEPNWRERLSDRLQRLREDFQIWRDLEGNKGWINALLIIVALATLTFVVWRLHLTRMRQTVLTRRPYPVPDSELTDLNRALLQLEKSAGPRPPGLLPLTWLQSLLPAHPSLNRLLHLHERARFGGPSLATAEQDELTQLARQIPETYAQVEMK